MTASARATTCTDDPAHRPRPTPSGGARQATGDGGEEPHRPETALGRDAWRITELEHEVVGLTIALHTRDLIGQAKGVLISHYGLDDTAAFALLRRVSQDTNTKLVDVAASLVERVRRRCPDPVQHAQVVTSVLAELRAGPGDGRQSIAAMEA